jgi:lipopolysaccharide/colanic/teichoic acid biosynthesis glycosyltransferase
MKRVLDILVASAVLILALPFLLILALAIRLKLGTPILFKQIRPGRGGRPFLLYKFRSMTDERDINGKLLTDGDRLTEFGRWLRSSSLDELPELWNVICGDMSLVGPRPLLMDYLPLYSEEQWRRHEVRPGITGWAQVMGRNAVEWTERFQLDVWYVDNQSLCLDLRILFVTIAKVLRREGVSQNGHVTMEPFTGNDA